MIMATMATVHNYDDEKDDIVEVDDPIDIDDSIDVNEVL